MATMFDATDPPSIPDTVPAPDYGAGYLDGQWPSFAAMVARFPDATHVSITAIPGSPRASSADVCDCEGGDYTPGQAAAWAAGRLAMGVIPCIYCSESAWGSVQLACSAMGVPLASVDWWIAAYPGPGAILYPDSVAHQWIDRGTYDESVVADGWVPARPVNPAPPPPPPIPMEDPDMLTSFVDGSQQHVFRQNADGSVTHWWYDSAATNPAWNKEQLP